MLAFASAKINLGLFVKKKRKDGYHDIETILYPLPWYDAIEVIPSKTFAFTPSGRSLQNHEDNLCVKAYQLLQKDFPLPPLHLYLHKTIPIGAGLGGGSADASTTLELINLVAKLKLSDKQLHHYASILGSDCPFFLNNQPALAKGKGEALENISLSLKGQYLIVIYPHKPFSTKEAYAVIKPKNRPFPAYQSLPKKHWNTYLVNDFSAYAYQKIPILSRIEQELRQAGAWFASMSGTGSSIYGIFDKKREIPPSLRTYVCWQGYLS